MHDNIVIKIWKCPESIFLILLNLRSEQEWHKGKKQSQWCINLYTSGCTDVFSIEGIFYVPHATALIISGRPRIPIVGAERIVVDQIKFYRLEEIRRKFAVGLNGLHPTFFCFSMFPIEIRKIKIKGRGRRRGINRHWQSMRGEGRLKKIWLPIREDQYNTTEPQQGDQVNLIVTQTKSSYPPPPTPCDKCQSVSFVKEKRLHYILTLKYSMQNYNLLAKSGVWSVSHKLIMEGF